MVSVCYMTMIKLVPLDCHLLFSIFTAKQVSHASKATCSSFLPLSSLKRQSPQLPRESTDSS